MKYVYPAIFRKDKKISDCYAIEFPDIKGAVTSGYTLYESIDMAEDLLSDILCDHEDCINKRVSAPTPINEVVAEVDEYSTEAFVTLIKADTDAYRKLLAAEKNKSKSEPSVGAA